MFRRMQFLRSHFSSGKADSEQEQGISAERSRDSSSGTQNSKDIFTTWAGLLRISGKPACEKQLTHGVCTDRDCLYPKVCPGHRSGSFRGDIGISAGSAQSARREESLHPVGHPFRLYAGGQQRRFSGRTLCASRQRNAERGAGAYLGQRAAAHAQTGTPGVRDFLQEV